MVWYIAIALHVFIALIVVVQWTLHRARSRRPPCGDCGFVMTVRHTNAMFCPGCGRVRGRPGLVLPDRHHRDPLHCSISVMLVLPFVLLSVGGAAMLMLVLRLWQ